MENSTFTSAITKVTFSWYDYILFITMLIISTLIGIYFGCFGSKQKTTKEYLMGGKTMKVLPIAISLVASHTSGLTLLALPADVYKFGAAYWLGSISMILLALITIFVYLPVFYNLQITSTYEYLEMRFNSKTRLFASFLYALSVLLYLPVVIYIPALAFSAATGLHIHLVAAIVCGVCIFYTTIGGLKAVVWTDTLQFTITVGAVVTVFLLGLKSAGGVGAVWRKSMEKQRLDVFDFDLDPTKRDAFWSIIIGLTCHWIGHTSVNQSCLQKFLSVPTLKKANYSVVLYCIGMVILKTVCVCTGLVMVAKYSECDPFTTKQISRTDQLLPYYVMDVAGSIPGLSGLFIAGIFSAALSTLSATLNCLAGTIYEDFIKRMDSKESDANAILKSVVVITGILSTVLILAVERLGGLLPLTISLGGVTNGALTGLFTLGILCPRANSKGAFYGATSSLLFMGTIVAFSQYYKSQGLFNYTAKPVSIEKCMFFNETIFNSTITYTANGVDKSKSFPFFLFRISHYYYTLLGVIVTITVGLTISYCTQPDKKPVKRNVLSPVVHFLIPKCDTKETIAYCSVDTALKMIKNQEKDNAIHT